MGGGWWLRWCGRRVGIRVDGLGLGWVGSIPLWIKKIIVKKNLFFIFVS